MKGRPNSQFFDGVDRVNVRHAVFDDTSHFLQALVGAHHRDCGALAKYVGLSQQLKGLESLAVGAQDSLSPFDKFLFVPHEIPDLNNVAAEERQQSARDIYIWEKLTLHRLEGSPLPWARVRFVLEACSFPV